MLSVAASESSKAHPESSWTNLQDEMWGIYLLFLVTDLVWIRLEHRAIEGESPVGWDLGYWGILVE